jgi:DNA mismatch repair protein MutS2
MTTVATTHQGALKAWAFTTEGAVSAAMEFDEESLRPTYRILMGAAGVSAGLDIAERLGIDPKIVAAARARLGAENVRSESYLGRLRELTADLERRQAEAQRLEAELAEERRRLDARAEMEREKRRRRAEQELDRALEEFRALARKELTGIRDKRDRKRAERELAALEQRLRMERERRVDDVAPGAGAEEGWVVPERLTEGMTVYVVSVAREGTVQEVRGDRAEVKLGRVNFSVKRSDLRLRRGSPPPAPPRDRAVTRREPGPVFDTSEAPRELLLLGKTVDEALPELDKFLDEAALSGYPEVRVIHGHGTGRLRAAVRRYLRGHVHVASSRPGKPHEGGDGATVVQLR